MSKFVLFAFQIINMGGEQQYCRNKLIAMENLGYSTTLVSCDKGEIYIDYLKQYKKNTIQELRYPPFCFTKKHQKKVITKLKKIIGECDSSAVIESVNPATSEWAELFAKEVRCKNTIFLLDEGFEVSPSELDFFKYKLSRKELSGMDPHTLPTLFKNGFHEDQNDNYVFDATCTNVVEDIEYDNQIFEKVSNSDYVIGIFSRLEKGFVYISVNNIVNYANLNKDKKILLIIIGGAENKTSIKKILKVLSNKPSNLEYFITGFLYPVPLKLLKALDVSLSTAGAAIITGIDLNIPTISIDSFSGEPIGILNYTTTEIIYNKDDEKHDLSYYLNLILKDDFCSKHSKLGAGKTKSDNEFSTEVKRQLSLYMEIKELEYYDMSVVKPSATKYKLYRFIGRLFGIKVLFFIHSKILYNLKLIYKKKAG